MTETRISSENYQRLVPQLTAISRQIETLSSKQWGKERCISPAGSSPAFLTMLRQVQKVARFDEPVLISGESGSGKELVAGMIHLLSRRQKSPYHIVNCPQFQDGNLAVSELFGHVRGSFTGAHKDRRGHFESASDGTVFLDEIADLPLPTQVMLLRVLSEGQLTPLGSTETRHTNVRVIAATNQPLEALVAAQQFRHDLFFRLRYFHIKVPPLRERDDDWRVLAEKRLADLGAHYGEQKMLDSGALRRLATHTWPGNVRELIGVVTAAYASADGPLITAAHLDPLLATPPGQPPAAQDEPHWRRMMDEGLSFWDAVHAPFIARDLNRREVRELIARGLEATDGSYRGLLPLFNLADGDYQRFMDFLRHHDLKPGNGGD